MAHRRKQDRQAKSELALSLGMAVAPFLSHQRPGLRAENQVAESVKAVKTSHAQIFRN